MPALVIQEPKTLPSVNLDSAGTAEQISATTIYARSITITAHPDNTGTIWVGDSAVADGRGLPAAAGESVTISPDVWNLRQEALIDLADVYFDGDTTNDDATITYMVDKEVHL